MTPHSIFISIHSDSQAGRQGREKFGSKKATKKRVNQFASTSNKVRPEVYDLL